MFLAGRPLKQFKMFLHVKRYSLDSDKASFLIKDRYGREWKRSINDRNDYWTARQLFNEPELSSIIIGAVADYSLDCYFVRRYADQRHLNEFKPLRVSRFISCRDINECVNSPDNNNQVI